MFFPGDLTSFVLDPPPVCLYNFKKFFCQSYYCYLSQWNNFEKVSHKRGYRDSECSYVGQIKQRFHELFKENLPKNKLHGKKLGFVKHMINNKRSFSNF